MFMLGDHKWLVCETRVNSICALRGKKHWVCTDQELAFAYALNHVPFDDPRSMTFEQMMEHTKDMQNQFADLRTCAQRSKDRLPPSIRADFERANTQDSDFERKRQRKMASNRVRKWQQELKKREMIATINKGGVPTRSKKLHSLRGLTLPEQGSSQASKELSPSCCSTIIKNEYESLWNSNNPEKRIELERFLKEREKGKSKSFLKRFMLCSQSLGEKPS